MKNIEDFNSFSNESRKHKERTGPFGGEVEITTIDSFVINVNNKFRYFNHPRYSESLENPDETILVSKFDNKKRAEEVAKSLIGKTIKGIKVKKTVVEPISVEYDFSSH